jgi:hypothetical protein
MRGRWFYEGKPSLTLCRSRTAGVPHWGGHTGIRREQRRCWFVWFGKNDQHLQEGIGVFNLIELSSHPISESLPQRNEPGWNHLIQGIPEPDTRANEWHPIGGKS